MTKCVIAAVCGLLLIIGCAVLWFVTHPVMAAPACTELRSGVIGEGDAGALQGPFLVTGLIGIQDPPAVRRAFLIWTRGNVWIPVDEFKGPFYLAERDRLIGRKDFTPYGVAYSGYSCR